MFLSNASCGALDTSISQCGTPILVKIAMVAEAAHLHEAIALTRFFAFAAQFGRFLPRLGPFDLGRPFLLREAGYGLVACSAKCWWAYLAGQIDEVRIFGGPALHKSHLLMMRCSFNFCTAICEPWLALRSPSWAFPP